MENFMTYSTNRRSDPVDYDDAEITILSTEQARQGEVSGHMRRVLLFSLIMMMVAGAILLAVFA